ncbi:mediator of DNA damage checkpoint protein 1 [Scomber scombrus]|uniref:Mediator of DNA damage checkpoint protein 1 n=1 Tax=Scomber scombrus TaxID=13677 RepID=A0AAV1P3M3_SCOSC
MFALTNSLWLKRLLRGVVISTQEEDTCTISNEQGVQRMDATQMISDSILESDEEENEEENKDKRGQPLAKLRILKNEHIPAAELPLFSGENVLGRDPNTCTLPLPASSVSKQHAIICISVHRRRGCHSEVDMEALVWDLGSMNGTRKGRLKLTPNVRYALSEGDRVVVADIPCQYVSCAVDTVSSQGDMRTPVSRDSGVKAMLPDASREKGGDTSTGSKKYVNEGTNPSAMVSLRDPEETTKTPARTTCLSFEQTPTQPQGSLVPESDSDSDGERGGRKDGRRKPQVSDSDSHKSNPTCSTFLSPTNKIVPESEDESPITPSSSTKNRPEEEREREEERATPGGTLLEESGQDVLVNQENTVSVTREEEMPLSTRAVATDVIPAFNMNSDTDVEGEEENEASVAPVTLNANQQADQPPNTAQFHMDSDTDVDEDEDTFDKGPKSVLFSGDNTKPPHAVPVTQPEGITMDSDTDVDDDADMSDTAAKAKPTSLLSAHTADSAPLTQPKDFHLDSDTDVDEEEENECGTNNTCSEVDEAPIRTGLKPTGSESAPAAPHSLNIDSDTDDEVISAPAINEPLVVPAVTDSCTIAAAGTSDSDTDAEEDSPLVIPINITALSGTPDTTLADTQSDSDAETDVDEPSVPPAGDGHNPADLKLDSDTDVEDKEADLGEAGEDQIPSLHRQNTSGLPGSLWQNCSTPVQISAGEVEEMETQAFLSPSSGPFRRAVGPAVRPVVSSCSDSQDEDFVVAETQSFILQTRNDHAMDPTQAFCLESSGDERDGQPSRGGSFQLGLSDSSHLQCQAAALAMESTQEFVSVGGGVNMEDTQAYAATSTSDRTSLENDPNLEATQAYGGDEEPARSPVTFEKEGQLDLALQPTQAYICGPCHDSEDETEEDDRKNLTTAETLPLDFPTSSTLAMAETQPVCAYREEESLATVSHISSKTEVMVVHRMAAQPEEMPVSGALSIAETQPICTSEDEDSIPGPRKRKAKQLEEETQPITSLDYSAVETQPMHVGADETHSVATSGNEESDDEDSIPGPQKRKAKQLRLEEEETQMLVNSERSAAETQPIDTCDDKESDDVDSIPGPRKKRKPKQLEEETQPITSSDYSAVETQPMHVGADETHSVATSGNEESDDEDSIPGPRKKRKAQQLEDETQPLTSPDYSAVETQPIDTCEDKESDDEDLIQSSRKRNAKQLNLEEEATQALLNSELSAAETQPMDTCEDEESDDDDSIPGPRKKRKAKPLQLEDEQTQSLTGSVVPADGTEAMLTGEDVESEESIVGQRKRKAKPLQLEEEETQSLTISEASTVESKPVRTNTDTQTQRGKGGPSEAGTSCISVTSRRGTRARLREEEKQAESSEPPRRQTRGNKAFLSTRGRMQKSRPDESEEKEKVGQPKRTRGKTSLRQQRDDGKEEEKLDIERNEQQQQQEGMLGEEKDVAEPRQQVREQTEEERRKINEETERQQWEEQQRTERTRQEKEEQERLQAEKAERLRLEQERAENERIDRERLEEEERERAARIQREKEQLERKEKSEKERLEREKAEREEKDRLEKEENERIQSERKEQEENERLETAKRAAEEQERLERERKEREHQARLETEEKEREEREKLEKEKQEKEAEEKQRKELQEIKEEVKTPSDDAPARRTRSRSNSSNSVSSERSALSVNTQGSTGRGRGRGRGAKRTSEPVQAPLPRGNNRRRTVAAEPSGQGQTEQDSNDVSPQGILSRSNSSNSLNSEISISTPSSQNRGRRSRQRGRGRKTETEPTPLVSCQSDQSSAPKPTARGRKSRKAEVTSNEVSHDGDKEKAESQQPSTTRGQRRANVNEPEPTAADKEGQTSHEEGCANEHSLLAKRTVTGRSQKAVKGESVEIPAEAAGGDAKEATTQATRRGRASSVRGSKNAPPEAKVKDESEKMEEEMVERRGRGRTSVVQKKKKEVQEKSVNSTNQDANMTSEPQTPTSRKRQAPVDSSPMAKTPRSSSSSPAAGGRLRAASQTYKVLFTGVVDEAGERVLARLGGCMAKGVADMNCLVTDKVRRTVKFLCAVAKGVPIVTTHWLEKSGKAGSFLSPSAFVVNDPEQEKKFNFCLQESLRVASSQPLLQGYEIHVTKSVKPEPVHMKDIISCSGATFLPKMPSTHKPQTVVISCEDDWSLCGPAVLASLPVVTVEFILTGILQQILDFQTHKLSGPIANLQPARGRGRGRKKT